MLTVQCLAYRQGGCFLFSAHHPCRIGAWDWLELTMYLRLASILLSSAPDLGLCCLQCPPSLVVGFLTHSEKNLVSPIYVPATCVSKSSILFFSFATDFFVVGFNVTRFNVCVLSVYMSVHPCVFLF